MRFRRLICGVTGRYAQRMKIRVTMASEERRSDFVGVIGIMTEESTKTILSNGLATSVAIIRYQSRGSTTSHLASLKGTRCGWLLMMLSQLLRSNVVLELRRHYQNNEMGSVLVDVGSTSWCTHEYPHMAFQRTGIRSPRC
jgi:hypothetical protein